jgi:hypothetical protein
MRRFISLFICMLLLSISMTLHAQTQSSYSRTGKLDDVVGEVLRKSGAAAGLDVITGCGAQESKAFTVSGSSIEESLNGLALSDKTLTWSKADNNSYRATIRYSSDTPLTAIQVPALHIEAETPMLAANDLFALATVRAQIAKLGYVQSPEEFGFAAIRRQKRIVDLAAGTLGDDLMALASKFGSSVWQLDQYTCGKTRTFRMNWIAR